MKASQAAYKAAEIMSSRGHCKNIPEDYEGKVCVGGAIAVALHGNPWIWDNDVFTILAAGTEMLGKTMIAYNNSQDVSGEDVILLLKKTARKLEEEGL